MSNHEVKLLAFLYLVNITQKKVFKQRLKRCVIGNSDAQSQDTLMMYLHWRTGLCSKHSFVFKKSLVMLLGSFFKVKNASNVVASSLSWEH